MNCEWFKERNDQYATRARPRISSSHHQASQLGWAKVSPHQSINHGWIPDGPPLIALDEFGSRPGDCVMVTSDGKYAREITGQSTNPARWTVMGIMDQ